MHKRSNLIYEFGPYRLDTAKGLLLRDGKEIKLRPKLFTLLVVLVQHSGQMLDKEQLLEAVWPDAEVEESNLTVSVNALRKTLRDEGYIETVARRGYRFAVEV